MSAWVFFLTREEATRANSRKTKCSFQMAQQTILWVCTLLSLLYYYQSITTLFPLAKPKATFSPLLSLRLEKTLVLSATWWSHLRSVCIIKNICILVCTVTEKELFYSLISRIFPVNSSSLHCYLILSSPHSGNRLRLFSIFFKDVEALRMMGCPTANRRGWAWPQVFCCQILCSFFYINPWQIVYISS